MIRLILIFSSLSVLVGCKSSQQIQVNVNQVDTKCKLALITKPEIIAHYDSNGVQFNWIKVKPK